MLLAFDILATLAVLALGFGFPSLSRRGRGAISAFNRLARRRALCVALTGLLALTLCVALSLIRWPHPTVHDEFSYLLAGDTFAHGRLTNPTHPLWVHFETFHIIEKPTYQSKYPPAQGLVLAAGQALTGYPIAGVWIATALACASICWMLYGWTRPRWAFLGGLIAAMHPGIIGEWGQSYWGGSVAAIAGSLILGSLPELMRRPRARHGFLLGIGIAILANARPYEGLLLLLPVGFALVAGMAGRASLPARAQLARVVAPVIAVLLPTALAMAYYNARVTGSATEMPYQLHEQTYAAVPYFLWQHPRPIPTYRNKQMADFQITYELQRFEKERTLSGLVSGRGEKTWKLFVWYLPPILLPTAFGLWRRINNRRLRFAALTTGIMFAGLFAEKWMYAHYAAPAAGFIFLLMVEGLRRLQLWRPKGKPVGRTLARCIPVALAALVLPLMVARAHVAPSDRWSENRAEIIEHLQRAGGTHLIIAHYGPEHWVHEEWVYNDADIDDSPIVWARDMGDAKNRELLDYFRGRQVWLLDADSRPARLLPYTARR